MSKSADTLAIHAGAQHSVEGSAVTPIFPSTVYTLPDPIEAYGDIRYPRLSNSPNHLAVAAKIAALEGAEDAVAMASGMAAISSTLIELLAGGGHLLASGRLYGGTLAFVQQDLPDLGMSASFVDTHISGNWEQKLRSETRAIYVESIENPTCGVPDHRAVVAFAKRHKLLSVIDNTFATPINFRPLELGYDIVVHSATKALNGHSDLSAGVVAASAPLIKRILGRMTHLGGSLSPQDCALLERGIKTLPLRVARHNENALALAHLLEQSPAVERVYFPGLKSHPDHGRAAELFDGFGSMLALELKGGLAATRALVANLQIPIYAPSLGGPETLVVRPAGSTHMTVSKEERLAAGVSDGLLRVSLGLEATADILADFEQALARLGDSGLGRK